MADKELENSSVPPIPTDLASNAAADVEPAAAPLPDPVPAEKPAEAPQKPPENAADNTADLSAIGAGMLDQWPEGQQHFIDEVKKEISVDQDKETAAVDFRLLRDNNKHYYDPRFCSTTIDLKTGIPAKNSRGNWKMRGKHKRSSLSTKKPKIDPAVPLELADSADPAMEAAALQKARLELVAQCEQTAKMADGIAWLFIEKATNGMADATTQRAGIAAIRDWLLTMEKPPAPPVWVVPILIYGQAFGSRFMAPAADEKRATVKDKITLSFAYLRGRLAERRAKKKAKK